MYYVNAVMILMGIHAGVSMLCSLVLVTVQTMREDVEMTAHLSGQRAGEGDKGKEANPFLEVQLAGRSWVAWRRKRGKVSNQARFSRSSLPDGLAWANPASRLKMRSPRSQVSRTMPRSVRPW